MFSGIIEEKSRVLSAHQPRLNELDIQAHSTLVIEVARPKSFDDIKIGDSIAVDGVCLTVEKFDDQQIQFTLGPETLKITSWSERNLKDRVFNLERSMRLGDRIHGHLVSGHVDTLGLVEKAQVNGEAFDIELSLDKKYLSYFPRKSSWAVAGVSLTINNVELKAERVFVASCLIPETLKRTNLGELKVGDQINIEIDFMIRTMIHSFQNRLNETELL
jgi:riboflavin synthase